MPKYTTEYIKDLLTGKPLTLEVEDKEISRLEYRKSITTQEGSFLYGKTEQIVTEHELSFLPSYEEVLEIFMGDGYTNDLVSLILKDFGLDDGTISLLLADDSFVRKIRGWFVGITCDGERAARTMLVVYKEAGRRIKQT